MRGMEDYIPLFLVVCVDYMKQSYFEKVSLKFA